MNHLYEYNKIEIIHRIDSVLNTVKSRLLPTFESIEVEAKSIEEKRLKELSIRFNPDFMDESDVYEDAFHKGVDHYIEQTSMKKEFLKSVATWLFHLFEKDSVYIFGTNDRDEKNNILKNLSINVKKGSDWFKCNHELRVLANAIKHGEGPSFDDLKKERADLVQGTLCMLSSNKIEITLNDLEEYVSAMKSFWNSVFSQCLQ